MPARSAVTSPSPGAAAARQAIVEAVVRVAGNEGFDALTYRAVAREAGVSHGLLRYHFGSLDAAIHAALDWTVDEAIARSPLAGEDLDEFAASLSRLVAESPEHVAFQWGLVMHAQRKPELVAEIRDFQGRYVDQIERQLEQFGFTQGRVLARTVFAVLNGIVLAQLVSDDPGETDEEIALLREMLERLRP
jgi:TetR/AcrR family transcriptional regulator, regulator of biofilm formation and stress response